jgi:hypothetical protein
VALLVDLGDEAVEYALSRGVVGGRLRQVHALAGERVDAGMDEHLDGVASAGRSYRGDDAPQVLSPRIYSPSVID